jgi:hypothetical protein
MISLNEMKALLVFAVMLPQALAFQGCTTQTNYAFEPLSPETLAWVASKDRVANEGLSEEDKRMNEASDEFLNRHFEEIARLEKLVASASVVFEMHDWRDIEMARPATVGPVPVAKLGGLLLKAGIREKELAVVRVPCGFEYHRDEKSGEEVMIDINNQLREAGFQRVTFLTTSVGSFGGCLAELYREGLPTREEARRIKERFLPSVEEKNGTKAKYGEEP